MSQGAATPTVAPPTLPEPVGGGVGPIPANAQMVTPGGGDTGFLSSLLGDTASKFVNLMGDTPEERQQNLEMFTKALGTVNQLSGELGQTSLVQRLGHQKGVEMSQNQSGGQAAAALASLMPRSPLDPDQVAQMMDSVGLGVRGIKEATGPERWPQNA